MYLICIQLEAILLASRGFLHFERVNERMRELLSCPHHA